VLFLQILPHSWYLQLSPTAYHAHEQTNGCGLVVGRLLVGGDDTHVAMATHAGVKTPFASPSVTYLKNKVLKQLAVWGSLFVDPLLHR
jgi:hypothetical protein